MMRWTLAAWFITSALAFPYNYLFRRDADFYSVRTRLDFSHQDRDREDSAKYFHEASFHNHYDGRFADRQLGYEERKSNLTLLIQTYLATMNDLGAETFIMHGSLLGWWWNRRAMPWDSDLDVMVSERSIQHLARYYNLTIYSHVVPDTDGSRRDYLLEVNPHCANATRDQINKIDARYIDTLTGLFIDITTLRRDLVAESHGVQGAMMVKDGHEYVYDDIYPLRDSEFEGYPVKIPFAYGELLIEEYGDNALAEVFFENHRFDPEAKEWVPLRYANEKLRAPYMGLDYWGKSYTQLGSD